MKMLDSSKASIISYLSTQKDLCETAAENKFSSAFIASVAVAAGAIMGRYVICGISAGFAVSCVVGAIISATNAKKYNTICKFVQKDDYAGLEQYCNKISLKQKKFEILNSDIQERLKSDDLIIQAESIKIGDIFPELKEQPKEEKAKMLTTFEALPKNNELSL